MLRFAADENFNGKIIRGLLRVLPELDVVRIQDTALLGADDATVLDWAAEEGRLLLTHDVSTLTRFAHARVRGGQAMPGVIEVSTALAIGRAIEGIWLLAESCSPEECQGQVMYLPL